MAERAVLIPIEVVETLKAALVIIPALLLVGGLGGSGGFLSGVMRDWLFSVGAFLLAIVSGAILTPLLLPWIPGRPFAVKGLILGIVVAGLLLWARGVDFGSVPDILLGGAWLLLIPALSAFLAMNFTGASTYTSLSGVRKEMRWALPLEIGAGLCGMAVLVISRFF